MRLGRTNLLTNFYLREHINKDGFSFKFMTTFSMMQDVIFVLTRQSSQKSKLATVARHIHVFSL
jgi:hypothetical protein